MVICAMTNSEFPALILYTTPTRITESGIRELTGSGCTKVIDVYTLTGTKIRSSESLEEALRGLIPGIYIVNGRKLIVK